MKHLIVAAGLTGALLLTGCGPKDVVLHSRCSKSQAGNEVTNSDGTEYECELVNDKTTSVKLVGKKTKVYRWMRD